VARKPGGIGVLAFAAAIIILVIAIAYAVGYLAGRVLL
jgi:hypothetical protein